MVRRNHRELAQFMALPMELQVHGVTKRNRQGLARTLPLHPLPTDKERCIWQAPRFKKSPRFALGLVAQNPSLEGKWFTL